MDARDHAEDRRMRIGIVGLGLAGTAMVPALLRHPGWELAAAVHPTGAGLDALESDHGVQGFRSLEELLRTDVDAVYIATPTELHMEHAIQAAGAGKHVLLEKPMASSLEECRRITEAAEENDVVLVIGHSHSFDPPVRAMRELVVSGDFGRIEMINTWCYTDWYYRPRRAAELDPGRGGGVTLRQGAHQFDVIRYLGGGMVASVRASVGSWDLQRPGQGSHSAFMVFENGMPATAVYSGYDHFPSVELTFDVTEGGQRQSADVGSARRRLRGADESALKGGAVYRSGGSGTSRAPHQPTFGLTLVSCSKADLRQSPDGVYIYGDDGVVEVPLTTADTPRDVVVHEFYEAVVGARKPLHDGYWGTATAEVCFAVLESARTAREVHLKHQVASLV